jgi:hypothetical protein
MLAIELFEKLEKTERSMDEQHTKTEIDPFAIYSVKELALILKFHPNTVRKRIKNNQIKKIGKQGNIRVLGEALIEYLTN